MEKRKQLLNKGDYQMNFEEAYKRLNEISVEMDNKDIALDKAVELYSEAAGLIDLCKKNLESAKQKVEIINGAVK